ncbi:MAG TPA: DUF4396 domain-containing protein [Bradyrhizobium sp.]
MFPPWLHVLSIAALLLALACAIIVAIDVWRHPQSMGIMNVVWPATALFGSVAVAWMYFRYGRETGGAGMHPHAEHHDGADMSHGSATPFPVAVSKGTLHCGSGCAIGDIIAEWLAFLAPSVAVWFGWHWLFDDKMYAVWVLDFLVAFLLGIVFQYFAIAPMRNLSFRDGMVAALEADTLSLIAWQIGMYGFMAFAQIYAFGRLFGARAPVDSPEFWFAMQWAMAAGFIVSFPVNWWLISAGIKEKM